MNSSPQLFTTIRIEDGKPILLQKHIDKLIHDYEQIHKESLSIDPDQIHTFLKERKPLKGIWRLNLYTKDLSKPKLTAEPLFKKELALKIYPAPFYETYPNVKKEDFSKRLALLEKAQNEGFDDWIFTDSNGYFLETCIYNIFWIQENQCYTPSLDLPLYFGHTLEIVLEILESLGFELNYVYESEKSVLENSLVFAVNSLKEIVPISSINQVKLTQDKTLYETILKAYHLKLKELDALQSTYRGSLKKCDISLPL